MKRSDILDWLSEYKPAENEFKKYYQRHGVMVPEKRFFDILLSSHGLQNTTDDIYSKLGTSENFSKESFQKNGGTEINLFRESVWMGNSDMVSIRQHPRYSPVYAHEHSFVEIAYVLKGLAHQSFYFRNGKTETIDLPEGALCIIPPQFTHSVSIFDDTIMINILIRTSSLMHTFTELVVGNHLLSEFFAHILYENDSSQNYLLFFTNKDTRFRELILDMMIEECMTPDYNQHVIYLMLGLFFTYLQRDYTETMLFSQEVSVEMNYIPQILEYIRRNYASISVKNVSDHFHISTSYLNRIFKLHTNSTVVKTIQHERMEAAERLLTQTNLSIQKIAEKVGYNDITHFIRSFKQHSGYTPLQFRKLN